VEEQPDKSDGAAERKNRQKKTDRLKETAKKSESVF